MLILTPEFTENTLHQGWLSRAGSIGDVIDVII